MPEYTDWESFKNVIRNAQANGEVLTIQPDGTITHAAEQGGGAGVSVKGSDGSSVPDVTELRLPGSVAQVSAGVAQSGLVLQKIGPFHLDKDTPNVNSDIIVLGDALVDGSVVLAMWALFPVGWKSNTNADCDFKIELASYPTPYFNLTFKEYLAPGTGAAELHEPLSALIGLVATGASPLDHAHVIPPGTDAAGGETGVTGLEAELPLTRLDTAHGGVAIVDYAGWSAAAGDTVTAIQLAVEVYANSGASITQGEADIYAIVATPAA